MPSNRLCFELKNCRSELEALHAHLQRCGSRLRLPPKTLFEINLVLDELFTNIVSYGYPDDNEDMVRISLSRRGGLLTLQIEDNGVPFNPLDFEAPELPCSLEECRIGGLGIHIIRKLTDEIHYQRKDAKNIVTIKKTVAET
jgi:anti-sigma regulatory factor (Ser/Thr protein kinase)